MMIAMIVMMIAMMRNLMPEGFMVMSQNVILLMIMIAIAMMKITVINLTPESFMVMW